MLEYFEAGGDAVAKLAYEQTSEPAPPPPPPAEPFAAEYFDNRTLAGAPCSPAPTTRSTSTGAAAHPTPSVPVRPLLGALDQDEDLRGGHLSVQRDG